MTELVLRPATPADLPMARRVLAAAFAGEPFSVGMYGESALDRIAGTTAEYAGWPETDRDVLVAVVGDAVVGVTGTSRPGDCNLCDRPIPAPGPDATRAEAIDHEFQQRCREMHRRHVGPEPHAHISSVAVDAAVEGTGVGRRLVAAAAAGPLAAGIPVVLECLTRRIAFYTRCGFRTLEEFDDPGGPGLRAALMRLDP
jgi:ribosomal protein S18 acetylase RimI-like enzyme